MRNNEIKKSYIYVLTQMIKVKKNAMKASTQIEQPTSTTKPVNKDHNNSDFTPNNQTFKQKTKRYTAEL